MSLHPDAQKRVQAELDKVVGNSRMPEFSDLESLVYVNAVIRETLRWHTIVPLSVSHATTDDVARVSQSVHHHPLRPSGMPAYVKLCLFSIPRTAHASTLRCHPERRSFTQQPGRPLAKLPAATATLHNLRV